MPVLWVIRVVLDSVQLLTTLQPDDSPPEDPYAIATITSVNPVYVAFEGNVDDTGTPIQTPQTMTCLSPYTPLLGDRVLMLHVGHTWVIIGSLSNAGIPYARYVTARTANAIAAGAYDTPPAVPSNPWSTSSTFSDPNTWSRITILKPCHIDYYCEFSGSGGGTFSEMQLRLFTATMQATTAQAATPGGGIYQGVVSYSGLMNTGEILDVILRNTGVGTTNIVYRTWVTFADATPLIAQQ